MKLAAATRLLRGPLRGWVVPRAHVSAKPAQTPTSPPEQAAALTVTFVSFLIPAGWVLSHLESYKKSRA